MRFLTFLNNAWQSIERIDFVDFFNGAFRARILSGTLTADRTQTWPNRDGEIAVGIPLVGNVRLRNTASNGLSLGSETASTGLSWIAQGFNAGLSNTTGSYWTAIGLNAGYSNTTGSYWTAIGLNAGYSNTIGSYWSAIGNDAGRSNTTGSYWMAQGVDAGRSNTTGSYWTAIGLNAGFSNTTGSYWSAIGNEAGRSNTTGSFWNAIGFNAGFSNTTGSFWTAIGLNAGFSNTTGNNWTAIGAEAAKDTTTASNFVCIGFNTGRGVTTGEGNTIIGANIVGLSATLTNTVIIGAGNGIPLITADSTGLRLGTTAANSGISLIDGSFSLRISAATLTANRTIANPDKDGTNVLAELPASFNAVVPLQGDTAFPTQAVSGAIAFTLSSAVKSACAKTTYRLTANGVNIPTFTGFTEIGDSLGYDNRSGILNVITFEWDGATAWYRVHQAKFALPTLSTIAITFPSRNAKITQDGTNTNVYYNNGITSETFTAFMTSAQTIPSGKSGRVTFRANQLMLVGFNNTSTLEDFNGYEYGVFGNSDNLAYTQTAGINGANATLSSGIVIGTGLIFYRLTRSSSGVVTAETSTNGTTWTLMRTFAQTFTGQLFICACLSGNTSTRSMEFISLEIEP